MRGEDQKPRRMAEEEAREGDALTFNAYDQTLKIVSSFLYLGRTLMTIYDDWMAVIGIIWKDRWTWENPLHIFGR